MSVNGPLFNAAMTMALQHPGVTLVSGQPQIGHADLRLMLDGFTYADITADADLPIPDVDAITGDALTSLKRGQAAIYLISFDPNEGTTNNRIKVTESNIGALDGLAGATGSRTAEWNRTSPEMPAVPEGTVPVAVVLASNLALPTATRTVTFGTSAHNTTDARFKVRSIGVLPRQHPWRRFPQS